MIKLLKNGVVKTTTLSGTMAISKMRETGHTNVQMLPDNPVVGQVAAFRRLGYGQMLSTGQFEFAPAGRAHRSQAETLFRTRHCTVSKGKDRAHRVTFIVKDNELENFCRYLMEEMPQVISFMYEYVEDKRGEEAA